MVGTQVDKNMSKVKSHLITIGNASVRLLAFHPNLAAGKNQAYVIVGNDGSLSPNGDSIRPDQTGAYLRVSELALKLSDRLTLHKDTRQRGDKALVLDERAAEARFEAQGVFAIRCAMCGGMATDSINSSTAKSVIEKWKRVPLMMDGEVAQKGSVCPDCLAKNPGVEMFGLTAAPAAQGG